jgi:hypothetical protein
MHNKSLIVALMIMVLLGVHPDQWGCWEWLEQTPRLVEVPKLSYYYYYTSCDMEGWRNTPPVTPVVQKRARLSKL